MTTLLSRRPPNDAAVVRISARAACVANVQVPSKGGGRGKDLRCAPAESAPIRTSAPLWCGGSSRGSLAVPYFAVRCGGGLCCVAS